MNKLNFNPKDRKLEAILAKALEGNGISKSEALYISRVKNVHDLYTIFSVAQDLREKFFGNSIFTYGFVYFTTYCRNDCAFCYYRRSNDKTIRYRKGLDEIVDYSKRLKTTGIDLIDLTMSEDPIIYGKQDGWRAIEEIIEAVKDETSLPIMISPGAASREAIRAFKEAGADWFAVYQETYNRQLYSRLRLNQDFDYRLKVKLWAKEDGMLIEDGMLLGVGEREEDWVDSVFSMKEIDADQVREMGFIGQPNTPMASIPAPPLLDEMKVVALLRLTNPDKLIPASYDVDGMKGLQLRLMAGANVVTSLIPPGAGLVGVAQAELDVDSGTRTRDGIKSFIEELGLRLASSSEYEKWIERQHSA